MTGRLHSSSTTSRRWIAMRVIGAVLALVCVVAGSSSARQSRPPAHEPRSTGTGVIRGRVVDALRGTPMPRVTVTAMLWRRVSTSGSPASQSSREFVSRHEQFTARSSADGSFTIGSLPAGDFNVSVQREGYNGRSTHRNHHVTLAAGATVVLPDFALPSGGVITGRVLDAYGEPVIRATVTPFGRRSGDVGQPLAPMGLPVVTDDRGRYRLFNLRPGPYTVHAVPRPWRRGMLQGDPRELLPGVAGGRQFTDAEFVDVAAGEEATLDVRLEEGLYATVAGRVLTETGEAAARASISIRHANSNVHHVVAHARSSSTGTFELSGVPLGRYQVVAEALPPDGLGNTFRARAAWTSVTVDGTRVDGVSLALTAGAVVRGRIEIDSGDAASLRDRPLRVAAEPVTNGWLPGGHGEAAVDKDALTFAFAGLQGPVRLTVNGLPPGWWVKAVTIDGRDVLDGHEFPARGAIESAVVVLSGRPTGVSGRVEALPRPSGDSSPVPAAVLVVPHDLPSLETALRGSGYITGVAADGTFRAEAVRPGSYDVLVVGLEMMDTVRDMTPAQVRALVDAHGATVDVVEGQFAPVTVRMVPK